MTAVASDRGLTSLLGVGSTPTLHTDHMTDTRSLLYFAASAPTAASGACTLERVASHYSVTPAVSAVNGDEPRDGDAMAARVDDRVLAVADAADLAALTADVDCAVVADSPKATDTDSVLELFGAALASVPAIYFAAGDVDPAVARSTPVIDGFVRQRYADDPLEDTASDGADLDVPVPDDRCLEHLVDEIEWQCCLPSCERRLTRGSSAVTDTVPTPGESTDDRPRPAVADSDTPQPREATIEEPRFERGHLETDAAHTAVAQLHEMATQIVACRSEEPLFELALETADDVLGFDASAFVLAADGGEPPSVYTSGYDEQDLTVADPSLSAGVLGKTYREKRSFLIEEVAAEPEARPYEDSYRSAISVPVGEYGVFQTISTETAAYSEVDRKLAEVLAAHVGETIRRIRVEHHLRERQQTVTSLHESVVKLVSADTETALFERTVAAAERILELDVCYLGIVEGDSFVPRGRSSWPVRDDLEPLPLTHGVMGETYRTGESVYISDAADDDRTNDHNGGFRSALTVPVGEFGVIQAVSTAVDCYDDVDRELLELLATHVEQALSRFRVEAELRDRREQLTRLHQGAARIIGAPDERTIYERALETTETVLELDVCVFLSADLGNDELVPEAYSSAMDERFVRRVPLKYGAVGSVYQSGEPSIIDDLGESAAVDDEWEQYRSALTVPIGEQGVFQAVSDTVAAFDSASLELVELLCSHVSEALARTRAETKLVEERDRLSALFENVPDPAVQYELSGGEATVQAVNDRFEAVFGFDAETIIHEDVDEFIVPPEYEEEAQQLNEALLAGETLRTVTRRQTATEVRDFLINVVPLTAGERSVEGYAIYTDITGQKRHERALTAKNERLDEFASIVSHDLRNPLNVAQGYLEIVTDSGDHTHLREVEDALDRMDELIDQLLTLSRHGTLISETERLTLHAVARQAWSLVDTGGAVLELGDDVAFEADRARLAELFENLFRNAVEHGSTSRSIADAPDSTDDEGTQTELTITVAPLEDGFAVSDDGIGIPAADRESVFESGFTTSDDGTGFGLSIVEQIAEAHGWTVAATESDAGGAQFEFRDVVSDGVDTTDSTDLTESADTTDTTDERLGDGSPFE
ncbi:GAF domain-containing sensor histidine kinase [Natrialbaceae archaeon A-CW1-1]